MIYLASPYSHADPAVREARYRAACRATAALLKAGLVVFSPIVHSHPLVAFALPTGWDFWERIDRAYLARCDEVVVLMLDGWEESTSGRGRDRPGPRPRQAGPVPRRGRGHRFAHGGACRGRFAEVANRANEKRPPPGGLVGTGGRSRVSPGSIRC